jgi:hypothetical protein
LLIIPQSIQRSKDGCGYAVALPLTTVSNTSNSIYIFVENHPYIYACLVILLSILTSWQLWKYITECEKFAKLDFIKARLKNPWIVNFASWIFGWLCIAFSGYCVLLFVKIISYIAYMKGELGVELLSLIQLDISIIIFMLFTRNCLTTLTIIIKFIQGTEINWKEYISLIIGFIVLSFLIVSVIGQYYHLNIQIILIVFIIDSIASIIYELNLGLFLSYLKEIIRLPWVKSSLLKLGWKGRLVGLGPLANAGGQNLNQEPVPSNRGSQSTEVQRGRGSQIGQRGQQGQGHFRHQHESKRVIRNSLSPSRITRLPNPNPSIGTAIPLDRFNSKVYTSDYGSCHYYFWTLAPVIRDNYSETELKEFLLVSGLGPEDISSIKLKWEEDKLIMRFQEIIKIVTRDIMDPHGTEKATCKVELLHIDQWGNRTYKALAIKDKDVQLLGKLYHLSVYAEKINPDIILLKVIDGYYQDKTFRGNDTILNQWKAQLSGISSDQPVAPTFEPFITRVDQGVNRLVNDLYGTTPRIRDEKAGMFAKALNEFKDNFIEYAKLKNPNPIGTLRESPLTNPNRSSEVNMKRFLQPDGVNRGPVLNSERGLERGTGDRNSPIIDQVRDAPLRREAISLPDNMNNEPNIRREAISLSDIMNNEPNNNRPVRRMSISDILNNEPNNSRPSSRTSNHVDNEANNNRPSSRISNSDPSNNGSTNNTRSFFAFSFSVDYSNYTEWFTNCIVNLFNNFMHDSLFYIVISFCTIVLLWESLKCIINIILQLCKIILIMSSNIVLYVYSLYKNLKGNNWMGFVFSDKTIFLFIILFLILTLIGYFKNIPLLAIFGGVLFILFLFVSTLYRYHKITGEYVECGALRESVTKINLLLKNYLKLNISDDHICNRVHIFIIVFGYLGVGIMFARLFVPLSNFNNFIINNNEMNNYISLYPWIVITVLLMSLFMIYMDIAIYKKKHDKHNKWYFVIAFFILFLLFLNIIMLIGFPTIYWFYIEYFLYLTLLTEVVCLFIEFNIFIPVMSFLFTDIPLYLSTSVFYNRFMDSLESFELYCYNCIFKNNNIQSKSIKKPIPLHYRNFRGTNLFSKVIHFVVNLFNLSIIYFMRVFPPRFRIIAEPFRYKINYNFTYKSVKSNFVKFSVGLPTAPAPTRYFDGRVDFEVPAYVYDGNDLPVPDVIAPVTENRDLLPQLTDPETVNASLYSWCFLHSELNHKDSDYIKKHLVNPYLERFNYNKGAIVAVYSCIHGYQINEVTKGFADIFKLLACYYAAGIYLRDSVKSGNILSEGVYYHDYNNMDERGEDFAFMHTPLLYRSRSDLGKYDGTNLGRAMNQIRDILEKLGYIVRQGEGGFRIKTYILIGSYTKYMNSKCLEVNGRNIDLREAEFHHKTIITSLERIRDNLINDIRDEWTVPGNVKFRLTYYVNDIFKSFSGLLNMRFNYIKSTVYPPANANPQAVWDSKILNRNFNKWHTYKGFSVGKCLLEQIEEKKRGGGSFFGENEVEIKNTADSYINRWN